MNIRNREVSVVPYGRWMFCLAAIALFLTACATPPGKLKDSDFVIRRIEVQQQVSQVVSAFYDGLRYCGPSSGGMVFVTHHGVPECAPPRSDGTVVCDLYTGASFGGRSDFVLGRAEFTPAPQGSVVFLRVQAYAANKEAILIAWEKFLNGQAQEVCHSQ